MDGRPRRGQSAKLDRSLAAQASRASGLPLAFHSFHPRAVCQSSHPGPRRMASSISRRASKEGRRPEPRPICQILTPPEQRVAHVGKLLSLIPISIPISHVEWSRQRGTLPQKT